MFRQLDDETRKVLDLVRELGAAYQPIYLIGGAVRDLAIGRSVSDFDFAVREGSLELAAALRRRLRAGGFTLDDERQTARIIWHAGGPDQLGLDFVRLVGGSLETDVLQRDFTINTLAVDLNQPDKVIDLLGGLKDLENGWLRTASDQSMLLDPLRVMRGVRMAQAFKLGIAPETEYLMRAAAPGLQRVSGERIRDELFKILELPERAASIQLLYSCMALENFAPEFLPLMELPAYAPHVHPLWEHTLRVVFWLERILNLGQAAGDASALPEALAQIDSTFKPLQGLLRDWFDAPLPGGRSRRGLFFLAALCHDIGKPAAKSFDEAGRAHFYGHAEAGQQPALAIARRLMLANDEVEYLKRMVQGHMRPHLLASAEGELSSRAIYRYYRDLGSCGVDLAVLSLADLLATYEDQLSTEKLYREVETARLLLLGWFSRKEEVVAPKALLSGNDLLAMGLQPGRQLGQLLEDLREAQAAGQVRDEDEARRFVQSRIQEEK